MFNILKKISFLYYGIILFILDLLLLIVLKGENVSLIHILCIDLALGIIIFLLLNIKNNIFTNILFVIINILLIIYALLIFIEVGTKLAFDTTYPIKTIISNYKNVILQYSSDVLTIVSNNILLIVTGILFIALSIILSRKIFFDKNYIIGKKCLVIIFVACILLFVIGINIYDKEIHSWDEDLKVNGLKIAILHNLVSNDNLDISIDFEEDDSLDDQNIDIVDESENIMENNYNVLDFDFDALNKNEDRNDFKVINNYVKSLKPTSKNEYTGLFKGKNLIMICAEAWNSKVVNEELFPTMYRLINNGFRFSNFYQPKCNSSTSGGEYAFLTGLIPVEYDYSFAAVVENNMSFTIPHKLKELGYKTVSFHNGRSKYYNRDETHGKLMGFDNFYANDTGLSELTSYYFPSDYELFDATFDIINKEKPFMAYYMTYTGHMPYAGGINIYYDKYSDIIEKYYGDRYSGVYKSYVAKNLVLEDALTNLMENLEKNDMLDDTVICMIPDHYPYGFIYSRQYTGDNIDYEAEFYDDKEIKANQIKKDKTEIILWSGCLEEEYKDKVITVEKPVASIDITPTLLNLFGIDFDSRIYPGHDVFSDAEGIVVYQDGKFLTENYVHDNLKEPIPDYAEKYSKIANNILNYSSFMMKKDYYGYLIGKAGEKLKICYLLFAGGPSDNTLSILDILEKNDVVASFFVVGDKRIDYIPYMKEKGHEIGIIADTTYDTAMDLSDYENSIISIFNKVYILTNKNPMFIYLPMGIDNGMSNSITEDIKDELTHFVNTLSLKYIDENILTFNEDLDNGKNKIVDNILQSINDKEHIYILLHDTEQNDNIVAALPKLISELKDIGYDFKKLSKYTEVYNEEIYK